MLRFRATLLAASWVLSACSPRAREPEPVPAEGARLELVFATGRLELARATPIVRPPDAIAPAAGEGSLRWELVDDEGSVLASGFAADSRLVRVEGFDHAPTAGALRAESGTITLELPDLGGTLRLFEADGTPIAETTLAPLAGRYLSADGFVPGKTDIDFATDLVGQPELVSGDGVAARHFNLLFVPEGYRDRELATFRADVRTLLEQIAQVPGYREHMRLINAWRQDIRSADSGVAEPRDTSKDTAFNVSFGDDAARPRRCLMPSDRWNTTTVASVARLRESVRADVVVVVANTEETGGCARLADRFIVQSRGGGSLPGRTLAHELGHALFALADEYEGTYSTCSSGANVSSDLANLPWRDLIRPGTPLPTTEPGVVGAYEGGGYCSRGTYRPEHACLMRQLDIDFCAVCAREVTRLFAARANVVDRVAITNRVGQDVWTKCDGWGAGCSGWTKIANGETATLELAEGRFLVTYGQTSLTLTAPSRAFSLYANPSDPFSPANGTDGGLTSVDGGAITRDAGTRDAGTRDAGNVDCSAASLRITEVQTGGATASDEFVEIHNPCAASVALDGVTLVYRSSSSRPSSSAVTLANLRGNLAARGFFVVGRAPSNAALASGLAASGGAVGLVDERGTVLDGVGWGDARNVLVEGRPAPAPPANRSIARTPTTRDTGDNAADFEVTTAPTPGR